MTLSEDRPFDREREHRERNLGASTWWRCVPITELRSAEHRAEAEARRAALTSLREKVAGLAIALRDPDYLTRYGHGYNDAISTALAEIDRALET